jgi:hypothetical protein
MLKPGPLEIIIKKCFFLCFNVCYYSGIYNLLSFWILRFFYDFFFSFGYCDFSAIFYIYLFMLSFYCLTFYTTVLIYVIVLGFIFVIVFVLRHDFCHHFLLYFPPLLCHCLQCDTLCRKT